MKMSVREARAQFAHALSAAERGERVTITKNGKPIAEIGPPAADPDGAETEEDFWERSARVRKELGLVDFPADSRSDAEWLADFDDPEWTREFWGPEYFPDDPPKR